MPNALVFECLNCSANLEAFYDRDKDTEIKCLHCEAINVIPRNGGQPFLKPVKSAKTL
jgi:DNA-directed RNA polymerase subunit RPC12/RpoP